MFLEGERKILEGKCELEFHGVRNLILTNKRLIFLGKKSIFSKYDTLDIAIPLEDVLQFNLDKGWLSGNEAILELKNGSKKRLCFSGKASAFLIGSGYDFIQSQQSETQKWFLAINQQIQNGFQENPLKLLQLRFAKGEISKEEYEEMRQVLEGHLNE